MAHYAKIRTDDGSFVDLDYAKVTGEASAVSVYCDETYDQRVMVRVTGPTHRCMTVASDTYFGLYDNEAQSWIWQQKMPIYLVGAIYMSTSSTSPSTIYGGTWQQITNAALRAATSNIASYSGSDTHTLTVDEMPAHAHIVTSLGYNTNGGTNTHGSYWGGQNTDNHPITNYVGGGAAHSIVQRSYNCYMWRRTA